MVCTPITRFYLKIGTGQVQINIVRQMTLGELNHRFLKFVVRQTAPVNEDQTAVGLKETNSCLPACIVFKQGFVEFLSFSRREPVSANLPKDSCQLLSARMKIRNRNGILTPDQSESDGARAHQTPARPGGQGNL
ncbi:MAG: hypothetical protein JWP03_3591 [Phycisphaerales bacterium]|nr:hypothetical protein [Phycisphaerales bacterium]